MPASITVADRHPLTRLVGTHASAAGVGGAARADGDGTGDGSTAPGGTVQGTFLGGAGAPTGIVIGDASRAPSDNHAERQALHTDAPAIQELPPGGRRPCRMAGIVPPPRVRRGAARS